MKKIIFAISTFALLMGVASCQKENLIFQDDKQDSNIIITATVVDSGTKVSLNDDGTALKQTWEGTETFFGFTNDDDPVEFNITSYEGSSAVLAQTTSVDLTGKTVHLIYYPGKTASDISAGTVAVDLSSQSASGVPPTIMIATATEAGGILNFQFQNACAIIGVIDPVITGINSTAISNLILSSHNIITEGTIQVGAGGSLELTPSLPSKFITMSLSSSTDGSGVLSGTYYFVTVPCSTTADYPLVLSATYSSGISKKSFGAKTMNASQYYIAKDKVLAEVTLPTPSGVKIEQGSSGVYTIWADRNLGATNVIKGDTGSYGDFFIWSDVTTIYSSRDWTATSQEAVLSFKPGWEDGYTVANIPYYNTTTGKCDKYNDIDGKKILDPVDDAIQVAFPGSGWRMPTYEEISALSTISSSTDSYSIMFTTSDPEPQTVWFPKAYIVNGVAYGYADANKIDGTNGLRIWSSRAAFSKGEDSSLGNDSWESRAMRFIDLSQAENGSRRYGVAVRPVIDK